MDYLSLEKLFYINYNEVEKIYKSRLNSESTHKLGIKINDFECFYMINESILKLIDDIYNINNDIEKKMNLSIFSDSFKKWIILGTLVEEIKTSNSIEGIHSTKKEIKDLLVNKHNNAYKRFSGMVNKYQKLLKDHNNIIETSNDIRSIYDEILLEDVVNEDKEDALDGLIFRKKSVEISNGVKIIHKGVNNEKDIINMMDKSLQFLNNNSLNILIRVAVFHYLFEYIHPFYNGNGRMGRYIASAYLANRLNILCALQLSVSIRHNLNKYYKAFDKTNDIRNKSDITIFIIDFLEIYLDGLKELDEKININIHQYNIYLNIIKKYFNTKQSMILDIILQSTLFNINGITINEIENILLFSKPTIRKLIKEINIKQCYIVKNNIQKPYQYTVDLQLLEKLKECMN